MELKSQLKYHLVPAQAIPIMKSVARKSLCWQQNAGISEPPKLTVRGLPDDNIPPPSPGMCVQLR